MFNKIMYLHKNILGIILIFVLVFPQIRLKWQISQYISVEPDGHLTTTNREPEQILE
jgi:hypothetical protein